MSEQKASAQAVGDILARASWLYECTHIPNTGVYTTTVKPLPAVACLQLVLHECPDPAVGPCVASLWNRCPDGMSSRERFKALLEVCFEQGWHSNEGLAS